MCVSGTSTSAFVTSELASGTHSPCARSPPCSPGAWDHTCNSVSQNTLCLSAYMSQRSAPANSHSCLFYICLPFLAPHVVASRNQQSASSWMDQLISFRCPNSQWVGNGFWSKAILRQCWKGRLDDKLQNLKCPVSNYDEFRKTRNLKKQFPWVPEKFRSRWEFRIHIVTHPGWHAMLLFTYFPQKQSLDVLG